MEREAISGFAETARGTICFEVSGPEHAPALIFFGLSTSMGIMAEISRGYRERLDPFYRFLVCDYPAGAGASERPRVGKQPLSPCCALCAAFSTPIWKRGSFACRT